MSNLTIDKLREMMRSLPDRDPFFNPLPSHRFGGIPVYEAPPPPPKVQVQCIRFADGSPILPAEFRAKINLELLARFGYQDDPFKDKLYMVRGYGIVCSPLHAGMLRNLRN